MKTILVRCTTKDGGDRITRCFDLVDVARASPACRPARYGRHVRYLQVWRRRLIAQQYDGSGHRRQGDRGSPVEMEALVVRMAHQTSAEV